MTETIRAAQVTAIGQDPHVADLPAPAPATGRVRVRMQAAALNFADLLQAQGRYQEAVETPFIPGLEGAGTVLDAHPDSGLAVGMRVAVSAPGMMAQIVSVDPDALQPIPDTMSMIQAAGFQVAYGTSHLALSGRGALQAGQVLVVLGAAGGVGLTAVQIGAAMGARVIAVARGADKQAVLMQAGAHHVIDSAACPDLRGALRDLGGADVIYDPVGAEPGEAAFRALRPGGRHLIIGFAAGRPPVLPLNHALVKNIAVHGFYWGGYRHLDHAALRDSMAQALAMFDQGLLAPVAGDVLPLHDIALGYGLLRDRRSIGKVVITL